MWTIPSPRGAQHTVLVVQADGAMDQHPLTAVVAVCDTSGTAPHTLISYPVTKPTDAVVIATQVHTFTISRIQGGTYRGIVPPDQMDAVSRALRLALDL